MKLNLRKLNKEIEGSKFSKTELALKCGIDRKTIENVLAGRDPKLSTVVSLASMLGVKISYLFDEEGEGKQSVSATDHSQAAGHDLQISTSAKESELEKENQELRQQLIEAQSKIIKLMEDRR
ncbi:MAG: helix-turn-helix domain-containing protein [Muribaculaceae bacterium]|nr:helix-turn-helix domain-containing protein [Muribaculaceae bacterium]